MGPHSAARPAIAAMAVILAVIQLAGPVQGLAYTHSHGFLQSYPCVQFHASGPGVSISECNGFQSPSNAGNAPASENSTPAPVRANATLHGADTLVEWEHDFDPSQIGAIRILRGTDGDTLHEIGEASGTDSRYVDQRAVVGGERWYAVEVVMMNDESFTSEPVVLNNW